MLQPAGVVGARPEAPPAETGPQPMAQNGVAYERGTGQVEEKRSYGLSSFEAERVPTTTSPPEVHRLPIPPWPGMIYIGVGRDCRKPGENLVNYGSDVSAPGEVCSSKLRVHWAVLRHVAGGRTATSGSRGRQV